MAGTSGTGGEVGRPTVVRELAETPKPPGKPAGQKAKDKSELHSRIFDYLEKEVPDDDPLELQFISMAKRAKAELPSREAFRAALKLAGQLDDYIEEHERKKMVANTQYNDTGFLNPGATQVNVNPMPAAVHTLQLPTQPPALQPQPHPMLQQQGQQGNFVQHQGPAQFVQQQPQILQPTTQGDDAVLDRVLSYHTM